MSKAKKEKKKKRKSLTRQIIRINILAHFVSLLVIIFITRYYMVNESISELNDVTDAALDGAYQIWDEAGVDYSAPLNPVVEAKLHRHFKRLCKATGLDYLYLYTINDDNTIRYIVSAAEDDEDDVTVNKLYGGGKIEKRELYKGEITLQDNSDPLASIDTVSNDLGIFGTQKFGYSQVFNGFIAAPKRL